MNETFSCEHEGHNFTLTIGYDSQGKPKEVFVDTVKTGTGLSHIVADACVVISIALQYNITPEVLVKSMGRVPDPAHGEDADRPASILGVIIEAVCNASPPWKEVLIKELKDGN